MRVCGLLALCGCNQFYGLDATKVRDAAPDAPDRAVRLSLVVGEATANATEAPVVVKPAVLRELPRIALVAEPFEPAQYVEDAPSGLVPYPFDFIGKRWRLEYVPTADIPMNGIPHEVQWSPADGAGHLVVSVVGRTERTAVPANTGYTLSMKLPSTQLYSFSPATEIFTTGYWSHAKSTVSTLTPTVDFSVAVPLTGGPGSPSDATKDVLVAVDYKMEGTCRVPSIAGAAPVVPLTNGSMTSLELMYETSTSVFTPTFDGELPVDAQARLRALLGPRTDDTSGGKRIFARLAHSSVPFTTSLDDVPAPVHIPIMVCPVLDGVPATPMFDFGGRLEFTKGTFEFVSNDRTVSGVRLRSSIAAIGRAVIDSMYVTSFAVAGTSSIKLGENDLTTLDDGQPLAGDPTDLVLGFESDPALSIHYYEVTLYRLAPTTLEPIRTYLGPDPTSTTIRFDPSLLVPGSEYAFAVRTYIGRPGAKAGDFETVQGPHAVATIFSRTFTR